VLCEQQQHVMLLLFSSSYVQVITVFHSAVRFFHSRDCYGDLFIVENGKQWEMGERKQNLCGFIVWTVWMKFFFISSLAQLGSIILLSFFERTKE